MLHVSAPGKLMLAGEWAVLEGNPCIVAAINKRVHSTVEPNGYISVSIDDFGLKDVRFSWDGKNITAINPTDTEKLKFTKEAIEVALRFLKENNQEFKPFKIRTYGEETTVAGKKVGFGSSAAAVVAIIASVLNFHGYKAGKEEIYKLSAIAHYYAQGKAGSAFDVAASTYGGIIVYKRFDAAWLTNKIQNDRIMNIVKDKWPGFFVEQLDMPENLSFAIAWTGESASTSAMMKQMDFFKNSNPGKYISVYDDIHHTVETLIDAWKSNDEERVLTSIRKNKELLHQLTKESGVNIETAELRQLADIAERYGTAGKLSGAGGGDCGFVVSFNGGIIEKVKQAWKQAGLHVIDADIDRDGVKIER